MFTRWGETTDQVWVKSRVTDAPEDAADDLFGAPAATVDRHPILGIDPVNCTPSSAVPGPWSDRLPHFRMGFTPSAGEEIQSEYHRAAPPRASTRSRRCARWPTRSRPLLQVTEIRTIAADTLWLSPQYGQDTVAIHFTWKREPDAVDARARRRRGRARAVRRAPALGQALPRRRRGDRPLYERLRDFRALAERLDPRGAFRNAWLERHVLGD